MEKFFIKFPCDGNFSGRNSGPMRARRRRTSVSPRAERRRTVKVFSAAGIGHRRSTRREAGSEFNALLAGETIETRPQRCACSPIARGAGFTLIETLLVVFVIVALAALFFPALNAGRERAALAQCANNLRQLVLANHHYASDHGRYVAAAPDIWGRNCMRWHGSRSSPTEPFRMTNGPLALYLGEHGGVKECPSFRVKEPGFEAGCGGYGYNSRGVGSETYLFGFLRGAPRGMQPQMIAAPAQTVMFTDTAFLDFGRGRPRLIEYSFAEAYFHVADNSPIETHQAVPSIHFRHAGKANVAWVDGHVSAESMTIRYSALHDEAKIGWFGPANNSLFDPF
jgi:prepilin-type processing-associated H-X9-DG protein